MSENRIIGVIGMGRAVGVTHLSILMANYFSGWQARTVALLEWGDQKDFSRMELKVTGRQRKGKVYRLLDVDYYKHAGPDELAACLNKGYQHVILDFGCMGEENKTEFYRCQKKLLVASFSEWQEEAFWEFYKTEYQAEQKSWIYLAAFGSEETRTEINKRLKISFVRIPLSVDAFSINREVAAWFDQLFRHQI